MDFQQVELTVDGKDAADSTYGFIPTYLLGVATNIRKFWVHEEEFKARNPLLHKATRARIVQPWRQKNIIDRRTNSYRLSRYYRRAKVKHSITCPNDHSKEAHNRCSY